MHHGSEPDPEIKSALMEQMRETVDDEFDPGAAFRADRGDDVEIGATGKFPEGKLTATDEGELRFRIGHTNRKIVLDFGKPVAWVGMDAKQARALGRLLFHHARQIE